MKVIFLDIDGVLNSRHTPLKKCFKGFEEDERTDPRCVQLLNTVVERTQAKIVISSAWRIQHSAEELQAYFKHCGFTGEIIGVTPVLLNVDLDPEDPDEWERGDEIQEWLDNNEVENFIILDDDSDMGYLKLHLVKTSFEVGLTAEDAAVVIKELS